MPVQRYSAQGPMRPDPQGGFVSAEDFDKLNKELHELAQQAIRSYQEFSAGNMTAEEAISTVAVCARFIGIAPERSLP